MTLSENIRLALRALAANRLRAALTMLGIIIGVGAVITLLSVGKGVEKSVSDSFQNIGTNLLFVIPGGENSNGNRPGAAAQFQSNPKDLTDDDAEALLDPVRAPDVIAVSPEYDIFAAVEFGRSDTQTNIWGVTPNFPAVRDYALADGDFFTQTELVSRSRVAVIGQTIVKNLYGEDEAPIGTTIKIRGIPFKVIGVLASKGGSTFGDADDLILIPLTTMQERLANARNGEGDLRVSFITAQVSASDRMEAAAQQITDLLRDRHQIDYRAEDDFSIITQTDVLSAFGQVTGAITAFLGTIAAISLLVGGIGIMNIMLVSVTERTREIGLRKAVGAKRGDVLWQFLVEAMTLSVTGGAIGIAFGVALALLIASLQDNLEIVVTWDVVAMATLFSAAIGLFFGIYPAYRASKLSPIEALRYE
ncbi:MAG: ABC transporter permease [Chloroflexi bacterium]|nr:ABC transporter permease [Chloroflexota bacterium]